MDRDSSNKDKRKRVGNGTQGHSLHSYIVTQSYTQLQRNPETPGTTKKSSNRTNQQQNLSDLFTLQLNPGNAAKSEKLTVVQEQQCRKTTSDH